MEENKTQPEQLIGSQTQITDLKIDVSSLSSRSPSVVLSWSAETGERFQIERSTDFASWTTLKEQHVSEGYEKKTLFTDDSFEGEVNGSYYYRVTRNK